MEDDPELRNAIDAVLKFATAWTAWENDMATNEDSLSDPIMKQAHADLIARFCTAKKRAYVDGLPTYSIPPTYSGVIPQNVSHSELQTATKAIVEFNCQSRTYRFMMQKKRGEWRLDSIKWKVSDITGWRNGLIGM